MNTSFKGLLWRLRISVILWSVTLLALGLSFAFENFYRCILNPWEMRLRVYAIAIGLGGLIVASAFSMYSYLYRRKYESENDVS